MHIHELVAALLPGGLANKLPEFGRENRIAWEQCQGENGMIQPVQITYRNVEPAEPIEGLVREEAAALDRFYPRITSCRVLIEMPHRHHARGNRYHVRIDLVLPGSEIVVKRQASPRPALEGARRPRFLKQEETQLSHRDLRLAIGDAFRAASRRLQDYVRRQRQAVKAHEPAPRARVSRIFRDRGYGFLETPSGRTVYFHRSSVLRNAFDRLEVGTLVRFVEERGEHGAQASTVEIVGRRHKHPVESVTAGAPV
jgi:cold shock CspA family protein